MQITIHDNQMNRVGFLSNEVPGLPSFFNDNWHRYLAEGAATFDFSVNKFKNGALQDYCQFLNDQAYISFTYEGEDFLFSILTSEETDDVITLNTATLNLELRNEQANPLVNSSSHNIQWYFDQMQLIYNAQITIGINEVSNLTRTISYDGQESKLARLLSVIGNFDAEFEFVTDLNDDGTLKGISLNIYKANDGASVQGVGTWRNDVTLYFGKNISDVRRTIDRTQIFNATTVTGAEGLNWNSSEWSVKNADGVEEFYKRKGSNTAFAPLSAELYPSQIKSSTGDFWIRKDFETEYKSANEMWGYALSQFKKYAYALVTYEVSAKSKLVSQAVGDGQALSIGDTVRIQDENFNAQTGGLILQARVSELEISFSNPSNNKLTFSNYVELESGISDDLEARLAQLIKDSTPYRPDITSTNGTQFKNGTGTTTLGAHIYFGSDTTETVADSYEWSKDGTVVANVQEITVDASGVADKAVYSFKAKVAGKVVASQSVTITNVNDGAKGAQGPQGPQGLKGDPGATGIPGQVGADGKTSYLHIAYATNSTGTAGFDVSNATGKTYIGQYTDFTANDSTDPSKYTWSLIKGDKGDKGDQGAQGIQGLQGPTGTQGVAGPKGADGKTQYTHIAYANSADGVTDFSTSDSNRTYIGMYVDFNINDSTTPGDYSWTLVKGADGTQGTPGKPGADGKTPYFHTAWSYSVDGTDGFTTVYPTLNLEQHTKMLVDEHNNLLWGSKGGQTASMTYDTLVIPDTTIAIDAVRVTQTATGQAGWRSPSGANGGSYAVTAGEQITMSMLAKNNASTPVTIALQVGISASSNQSNPAYVKNNIVLPADGKVHYYASVLTIPAGYNFAWSYVYSLNGTTSADFTFGRLKVEHGSTATPHMPSSSEVTTADWPSYIGQYTDFTQADSTNPSDYTWSLIRGNDGADGQDGKNGTNGKDGDPGKVVSDTEPTTRFKGLTWKYSGTADLTASDGTVIKPNIEYYYNGTKWLINLIEANQLNVNELAAISAYLGHVYAAIVEDKQPDGSGFLLDSEKQLLRVNKTANTYNQIFSEGLTTFAKISDLPGIGNIIPGANYISAILAGNFLQFGQYSTAVNSDGVPVGGVSVGEGSISFGQTTSGSYGFTLTGDLTVAGNIKSLKDTDWIDIPPASGWGGIMRYMIAEGKFYLRLTGVTNPAVPAATARTMCTIPTTAVPLGGIRGIPIMSYGQPIAELVINANGTVQFYPNAAVGTGQSLHVFVQGIPLA